MNFWQWLAVGVGVSVLLALGWMSYEIRRNARRAREKAAAQASRAINRRIEEGRLQQRLVERAQREAEELKDVYVPRAPRATPVCACAGTYICETCRRKYNEHRKREKIQELGAMYGAAPSDTVQPLDVYAAFAPVIFSAPDVQPDWSGGGGESGGGGASGSWDSGSSSDSSSFSSD